MADRPSFAASLQQHSVGSDFDLSTSKRDLVQLSATALQEHHSRVQLAHATAPGPNAAPGSDTLEAATIRAKSAAEMLRECATLFPSLKGILKEAGQELTLLSEAADSVADEQHRLQQAAGHFERDFRKRVEEARDTQAEELAAVQRAMAERDADVESLERTADSLRKELAQRHQGASEAAGTIAALQEELRTFKIDVEVKRDALAVAQNKVNSVVTENLLLRKISSHNESLLQEVDELRQQLSDKTLELRDVAGQRRQDASDTSRERETLVQQLHKARHVVQQQQEELALMRRAYHEAAAIAGECRRQRDESVSVSTPRPEQGPMIGLLGLAPLSDKGVGPTGRHRTSDLAGKLVSKCNELQSQLRAAKSSLASQCRMAPILDTDDYEAVQLKAAGFPPAVPIMSRTTVALGRRPATPPFLRFEGIVLVRSVSLAEILGVFADFRGYVKKSPAASDEAYNAAASDADAIMAAREDPKDATVTAVAPHAPAAYAFASFLWNRLGDEGGAVSAAEGAYSYHAGLQQWQHAAPQAECMLAALEGRLPLSFYDTAIAKVRAVLGAMRDAASKLGGVATASSGGGGGKGAAAAAKKKMSLKRRAFFEAISAVWPSLSDGDQLRLRAVANTELDRLGHDAREELPIDALLEEPQRNGDGSLPPFAAALLRVEVANALGFSADVLKTVWERCPDGWVTPKVLQQAIGSADPERPTPSVATLRDDVLSFASEIGPPPASPKSPQAGPSGASGPSERVKIRLWAVTLAVQHVCVERVSKARPVGPSVLNDAPMPTMDPRKLEEISRRAVLQLRKGNVLNASMSMSGRFNQ